MYVSVKYSIIQITEIGVSIIVMSLVLVKQKKIQCVIIITLSNMPIII